MDMLRRLVVDVLLLLLLSEMSPDAATVMLCCYKAGNHQPQLTDKWYLQRGLELLRTYRKSSMLHRMVMWPMTSRDRITS